MPLESLGNNNLASAQSDLLPSSRQSLESDAGTVITPSSYFSSSVDSPHVPPPPAPSPVDSPILPILPLTSSPKFIPEPSTRLLSVVSLQALQSPDRKTPPSTTGGFLDSITRVESQSPSNATIEALASSPEPKPPAESRLAALQGYSSLPSFPSLSASNSLPGSTKMQSSIQSRDLGSPDTASSSKPPMQPRPLSALRAVPALRLSELSSSESQIENLILRSRTLQRQNAFRLEPQTRPNRVSTLPTYNRSGQDILSVRRNLVPNPLNPIKRNDEVFASGPPR